MEPTCKLVLKGHYLRVGVVDDLVHLRVHIGVFLRERLCSVLLVETIQVLVLDNCIRAKAPCISCVLWYAQNPSARPAHSIIVFGSKPLKTLVL